MICTYDFSFWNIFIKNYKRMDVIKNKKLQLNKIWRWRLDCNLVTFKRFCFAESFLKNISLKINITRVSVWEFLYEPVWKKVLATLLWMFGEKKGIQWEKRFFLMCYTKVRLVTDPRKYRSFDTSLAKSSCLEEEETYTSELIHNLKEKKMLHSFQTQSFWQNFSSVFMSLECMWSRLERTRKRGGGIEIKYLQKELNMGGSKEKTEQPSGWSCINRRPPTFPPSLPNCKRNGPDGQSSPLRLIAKKDR